MAIGLIFDAPDITQAQYDQVRTQLHPDGRLAPGCSFTRSEQVRTASA